MACALVQPAACSRAPAPGGESAEAERAPSSEDVDAASVARRIRDMLSASARAWNAGDLDGFLDDYSSDPSPTFVTGAGVLRGLEEVRARYLRTYWSPGSARDSLRFEDIRVRPLGGEHALAHGRYVLYRPKASAPDSITGTGRFSLVLRKAERGWKIVHDHSSAAPEPGGG